MAEHNENLATTKDGEIYNKLQRPADYGTVTSGSLPSLASPKPSASSAMKRKHDVYALSGRKRQKSNSTFTGNAKNNETRRAPGPVGDCGMRTTLPCLDDGEQTGDTMAEALAYLRSVRTEASTIPTLLVAPTGKQNADNEYGNTTQPPDFTLDKDSDVKEKVIYCDGVWMALNESNIREHELSGSTSNDGTLDIQTACRKRLVKRFKDLQQRLGDIPHNSHTPDGMKLPDSKREWLYLLESSYPTFDIISALSEDMLFLGLRACASSLHRSETISREKCCWIWTLLALVGDAGTLDHRRVSELRDLGVKAGRMEARLQGASRQASTVEVDALHQRARNDGSFEGTRSRFQDEHGTIEFKGETKKESGLGAGSPMLPIAGDTHSSNRPSEGNHSSFEGNSQSEGNESTAEDEGEILEDAQTTQLEEARARLLAQLGDRLVLPDGTPHNQVRGVTSIAPQNSAKEIIELPCGNTEGGDDQREGEAMSCSHDTHDGKPHLERAGTPVMDVDPETLACIEMILTIVAECYGQRDLLESRKVW